ncbi:MAG: hypothetical protein JSV96_03565 [Candidatus Aminicenantes bacterium]|nr:MAG: hypothetical protein JSV96_03565 [Candidatus Aminicenantes bacterium]
MKKKVFLIILLMLFISSCVEDCPPTVPEDEEEEEFIEFGDISAHYYRTAAEISDGSDVVRIFVSWMNYQSVKMNKEEEDHFQLDLIRVPNNFENRGDYESAHFIRIVDGRRGKNVKEKMVLNGTELTNVGETEDEETESYVLYFWFDGKNVYN